jgi:hypothetical protein
MLIPIRGRYRVSQGGYERTAGRIIERSVAAWQPLLIVTKMAPEIANIGLDDDTALERFLARWGLPVVRSETEPASIKLTDIWELVRQVRTALVHEDSGEDRMFAMHFRQHAFLDSRPTYDPRGAVGTTPIYVECRDPASFAWMQLARRGEGEYRKCGWCGTHFTVADRDGHRRSRQYCSDRCRVAANRAKKRGFGDALNPR